MRTITRSPLLSIKWWFYNDVKYKSKIKKKKKKESEHVKRTH